MTEEEWLTGTDLRWLMDFAAEKVSRRKSLLFACAIAETVAYDPATLGGQTLELVERYADGPLALAVVEEADLLSVRAQVQQRLRDNPRASGPDLSVAEQLLDVAMSADPVSLREE